MWLSQRHLPHDAAVGPAEALLHAASLKLSTLKPQTIVNTDINLWPEDCGGAPPSLPQDAGPRVGRLPTAFDPATS